MPRARVDQENLWVTLGLIVIALGSMSLWVIILMGASTIWKMIKC